MKTKVFLGIAIRIIVLFGIGMMGTFIPENLRDFFGDTPCHEGCYGPDENWIWGARHYWYFWGMFILFILALVNVVVGVVNLINKNYDTSEWI